MLERKCEKYWNSQEEKKKEFDHMEIFRINDLELDESFGLGEDRRIHDDVTLTKFEVRNKNKGIYYSPPKYITKRYLYHLYHIESYS